jgi:hypothetical protein
MTASITLAGAGAPPIAGLSVRMFTPWQGTWCADVELDPELPVLPVGPVVLTIGLTTVLKGVIDPRAKGVFGSKAGARIVGGVLGGWDKDVTAQHFHNDAGILNAVVIAATAAQIGEVAAVAIPKLLGPDYVRSAGPASRVLAGLDWHIDPITGATVVAPRIPQPGSPLSFQVLDFDPIAQRAEIATEDLLAPGTILVDPRFGTLTVRDVEQRWSADGARATAWCGDTVKASRLAGALQRLAIEACGIAHLRSYVCRVVLQAADGRLALQPVKLGELNPATLMQMIPCRFGIPGIKVKIPPGTEVVLEFQGGDPSQPYVRTFAPGTTPAIEIEIDSLSVKLGGPSALPLAPGPWAAYVTAALLAFVTGLNPGSLAAQASTLAAALVPQPAGPMPLPLTLVAKGA